jgi:hypothetical protein
MIELSSPSTYMTMQSRPSKFVNAIGSLTVGALIVAIDALGACIRTFRRSQDAGSAYHGGTSAELDRVQGHIVKLDVSRFIRYFAVQECPPMAGKSVVILQSLERDWLGLDEDAVHFSSSE